MPYEFSCETCGPFDTLRPIAEAGNPMRCPTCGASARRVYTVPGLTQTPAAIAAAHLRNERSVHEPQTVKRTAPEEPPPAPKPRRGHGRPWQLGH